MCLWVKTNCHGTGEVGEKSGEEWGHTVNTGEEAKYTGEVGLYLGDAGLHTGEGDDHPGEQGE